MRVSKIMAAALTTAVVSACAPAGAAPIGQTPSSGESTAVLSAPVHGAQGDTVVFASSTTSTPPSSTSTSTSAVPIETTCSFATDAFFATSSAELSPEGALEAVRLTRSLRQVISVEVVGYTDIRGSVEGNKILSTERAQAFADALVAAGLDANRITVRGMGASGAHPADSDPEVLAGDRRVDVRITALVSLDTACQ